MNFEKSSGAQPKILIVDDNQLIVRTMAAKFNRAGYETAEALDGAEAIAAVRKERPDLIVLDLNLPTDINGETWDGYRIIEWLRHMKESRTIPIITITGAPDSLDMERNLDLGAVGFLFKPLDYNELLRLVRNALGATVTMAA